MITFFLQDYRIGGPHKQLSRYLDVLSYKEKKNINIIKPKNHNNEIGLINLKRKHKYLYFFEQILNIFYIFFKRKVFFNKNKISCIFGINNLSPIISSKILNKKVYWYIVEDLNSSTLFIFHIINFIFRPKIIFIDNFLIKKTGIIPHSILHPIIHKNKKRKKIKKMSKKNINLICVGNINEHKGYDFLINELIKNSVNCNLYIIGKKLHTQKKLNHRLKILKQRFEKSSKNKIHFLGFKNEKIIKKYFDKSDLFILPSYSEGCPNVILEAMSYGCLVMASDVGGIPNIIKHNKNGFIFKHKKNNFFKIYKMIISKNLQELRKISKVAKKSVEKKFGNKKTFHDNYNKIFFNFNLRKTVISKKHP